MNQKQTNNQEQQKNEVAKLPDIGKAALQRMISQVEQFATIEGTPLTDKEKSYASGIVSAVIKKVEESKVSWNEVDVKSVIEQVKTYARLGLSIQDQEIYPDMRRNGKTNKYEVNIKKQYQGIEKELIKWCSKKIIRFLFGVICKDDVFETETDFETGLVKIVKHVKSKNIDRNNLDNITGAYYIAYVDENDKLIQYSVEIDRSRIMRAYNASPTNEKPIWKADTQRMVLKTASWCLYKYVLRPFINVPVELKDDWNKSNDKLDFDNIEEAEIVATEEVKSNANQGQVIDVQPTEVEIKEQPKQENSNVPF